MQELLLPPATVLGLQTREETPGCVTPAVIKPREKFRELPLKLAVSIAELLALTAAGALAVKPMLLVPDAMVTNGGTLTDVLPLLSEMMVELVTAPVRLTVHAAVPGGVRIAGVHVRFESVGAAVALFKVSVKVLETPLILAVSRAEPLVLTAVGALAVNPAVLAPAETVTDAGTLTDVLPLVSATLVEVATTALKLTVQDDVAGGVKLEGVHVTLESAGVAVALFKVNEKVLETPLILAVSTVEPLALTAAGALAVNPAVLAPAETVTDAGTLTDALPLVSATLVEVATTALKFTVQDDVAGGVKLAGEHVTLESAGATVALFKISVKVFELPLMLAVSRAEPVALTAAGALAVNPALLAPAETRTEFGTLTDVLPLVSATLVEVATAALKLTVQDAVAGGVRLEGEHVTLESAGAAVALFKVSVKVFELPPMLAVSRAEPVALTAVGALAVNPALLAPAETMTDAGTLSDALPLISATLVEVVTAALKFTVQDDVAGGIRLAGVQVRLETVGTVTGWMIVMVVPVPVVVMAPPLESGAERPAKETTDEELVVPVAI